MEIDVSLKKENDALWDTAKSERVSSSIIQNLTVQRLFESKRSDF